MEDIQGRPVFSSPTEFYSVADRYTLDRTYPVQERGEFTFTEAIYQGVDDEQRYCIAKRADPTLQKSHPRNCRLQTAWLVQKILSVPHQCLQVEKAFEVSATAPVSGEEALAEMREMRVYPGHEAILGVLGIAYGGGDKNSIEPDTLLLDNFVHTLADHLVTPSTDLRLSETTGFHHEAWLKLLENSYAGLHYVHYMGEMQLVAVSPKDLVFSSGGQWMWSDFSQVRCFGVPRNNTSQEKERIDASALEKIDADFAHFAQQLFLALPWEYTRHAMPELLEAHTPEDEKTDQGELLRALKLLYSMAHTWHADDTKNDHYLDSSAVSRYGNLLEKRIRRKNQDLHWYIRKENVRDKRLVQLNKWKETLNEMRWSCHFPALPAPDKKTHLMQLAGFAKPAVFE